jgi:hypothetical protein
MDHPALEATIENKIVTGSVALGNVRACQHGQVLGSGPALNNVRWPGSSYGINDPWMPMDLAVRQMTRPN